MTTPTNISPTTHALHVRRDQEVEPRGQSLGSSARRKPRVNYERTEVKIPDHYLVNSVAEDGVHEVLTRRWFKEISKLDRFWADLEEHVSQRVLKTRLQTSVNTTINTTLAADTAESLKAKQERKIARQAALEAMAVTSDMTSTEACATTLR